MDNRPQAPLYSSVEEGLTVILPSKEKSKWEKGRCSYSAGVAQVNQIEMKVKRFEEKNQHLWCVLVCRR